jgi:hypothetical protein
MTITGVQEAACMFPNSRAERGVQPCKPAVGSGWAVGWGNGPSF